MNLKQKMVYILEETNEVIIIYANEAKITNVKKHKFHYGTGKISK